MTNVYHQLSRITQTRCLHLIIALSLLATCLCMAGCSRSPDSELETLREKAIAGDINAQYNLAVMYDARREVPIELPESPQWYNDSAQWYEKAADGGHFEAQRHLAYTFDWMAYKGDKNRESDAIHWLTKAAEQGDHHSMALLGGKYENGWGMLPQDDVEAYVWYYLAAADGDEDNAKRRDRVASRLTPEVKTGALKTARELQAQIETRKRQAK